MDWWFYSLSAIAQIQGTLLALGGAILVFRIQIIEKELIDFRSRLIKGILSPITELDEITFYYFSEGELIERYKENMKKIYISDKQVAGQVESEIQRFYGTTNAYLWCRGTFSSYLSLINAKKFVKKWFSILLIILSLSILINILALSIITPDAKIFIALLLLFIVSLGINAWAVWEILTKNIFDLSNLEEGQDELLK